MCAECLHEAQLMPGAATAQRACQGSSSPASGRSARRRCARCRSARWFRSRTTSRRRRRSRPASRWATQSGTWPVVADRLGRLEARAAKVERALELKRGRVDKRRVDASVQVVRALWHPQCRAGRCVGQRVRKDGRVLSLGPLAILGVDEAATLDEGRRARLREVGELGEVARVRERRQQERE
eukprot:3704731-Prymnesium_polylepis.1